MHICAGAHCLQAWDQRTVYLKKTDVCVVAFEGRIIEERHAGPVLAALLIQPRDTKQRVVCVCVCVCVCAAGVL